MKLNTIFKPIAGLVLALAILILPAQGHAQASNPQPTAGYFAIALNLDTGLTSVGTGATHELAEADATAKNAGSVAVLYAPRGTTAVLAISEKDPVFNFPTSFGYSVVFAGGNTPELIQELLAKATDDCSSKLSLKQCRIGAVVSLW